MEKKLKLKGLNPAQIISLSFLGLIAVGGVLLYMPFSVNSGMSIGFVNAFFTATSATCVTGLVIADTATTFNSFGQGVILALIQLGGLGFMTITAFVYMIIGKKITLKERMVLSQSINEDNLNAIKSMLTKILTVTFAFELAGALLLAIRFIPMYGWGEGIYKSVFHSISAFCNAGFDIFGRGNSLTQFVNDPIINITIMLLIIAGGLGFVVIGELGRKVRQKKKFRFSLHTKIVLIVTGALILFGAVSFFLLEMNNINTLGNGEIPPASKVMGAFFQSVTPRTAGFNTIDQGMLTPISKFLTMLLMFIGASPSGTGGGVKTTTFAVCLLFVRSVLAANKDVNCFKRRIETGVVTRAIVISMLSLSLVVIIAAFVTTVEHGSPEFAFINSLYEVISAFGTVGLSTGITPTLSAASKIAIMLTMFAGRVGLLTFTLSITSRMNNDKNAIRFPEDRVIVG